MTNSLKKNNRGFTIIEVLIVLAIAGLILLIVFLAVPALQRNSRNTQSKNEAASILGAVSEFTNNNNGKLPASTDSAKVISNAKLTNITTLVIENESQSSSPSSTQAVLKLGAKCTSPTGALTDDLTTGGTLRQVALLYQIEDSGGPIAACQEG